MSKKKLLIIFAILFVLGLWANSVQNNYIESLDTPAQKAAIAAAKKRDAQRAAPKGPCKNASQDEQDLNQLEKGCWNQ